MTAPRMTKFISDLLAVWIVAVVVGVGAFAWAGLLSDPCEAKRGDSNYGQVTWSWAPIGHGCKWTRDVNGFDRTDTPGPVPSFYVATLVIAGVGLGLRDRRTRRTLAVTAVAAVAAVLLVASVDWVAAW